MKRFLLIGFLFVAGCASNPLLTPVYAPGTTNVVQYVPAAAVTNALGLGAQVAPLVPPPFGTILSGVLGLATVGLGTYAKIKSGQLTTHQAMLNSVILGVEKAGTPQTKQVIQDTAVAAGVQGQLDPIVRQITSQLSAK